MWDLWGLAVCTENSLAFLQAPLLIAESYSVVWVDALSDRSPAEGHLAGFLLGAAMNGAALGLSCRFPCQHVSTLQVLTVHSGTCMSQRLRGSLSRWLTAMHTPPGRSYVHSMPRTRPERWKSRKSKLQGSYHQEFTVCRGLSGLKH